MSIEYWTKQLQHLPSGKRIPAFFFAHGSPLLLMSREMASKSGFSELYNADGAHANFLKAFGSFLMDRYKPSAVVVFSAHWDTSDGIEIMANDRNRLLYDYYGFPKQLYEVQWESRGSPELAKRIKGLLEQASIRCRLSVDERGLDHGVFVPFIHMFPLEANAVFPIPVVELSMHASLNPQDEIELGRAVAALRDEGVVILSGGLTVHNLRDRLQFSEETADECVKDFDRAVRQAAVQDQKDLQMLKGLVNHRGFRKAHPEEDHFVPIYIAAGAGSEGCAHVLCDLYAAPTIAFGMESG